MVHTYTSTYHHSPSAADQQSETRPAGAGTRASEIPRYPRSAAPTRTRSGDNAYHYAIEDVTDVKLYYLLGLI